VKQAGDNSSSSHRRSEATDKHAKAHPCTGYLAHPFKNVDLDLLVSRFYGDFSRTDVYDFPTS
jgi:hypothetical protein